MNSIITCLLFMFLCLLYFHKVLVTHVDIYLQIVSPHFPVTKYKIEIPGIRSNDTYEVGINWDHFFCLVGRVAQSYSDWLRAGRSGDQIPMGVRFFAHVQTGPGAHPASCIMGTGSFPGVKRPRRDAEYPPLLTPRLRKSRAIPVPTL
jgi:hypothetical protein